MIFFCLVESQKYLFIFLRHVPDASALRACLYLILVIPLSHVQRQDGNLTVDGFSWNMSGKTPAHNFCATINKLSNQFIFTFNSRIILEPVH